MGHLGPNDRVKRGIMSTLTLIIYFGQINEVKKNQFWFDQMFVQLCSNS